MTAVRDMHQALSTPVGDPPFTDELEAIWGASSSIHLDLHLAMVDQRRAPIDHEHLSVSFLERQQRLGIALIPAAPEEVWSLNCPTVRPGLVLMSEGSPRTQASRKAGGIEVVTGPYSEIQKNRGGMYCSTMELLRRPPNV